MLGGGGRDCASWSHNGLLIFCTFACLTFHILLSLFGSEWEGCQEGNKKLLWFYVVARRNVYHWNRRLAQEATTKILWKTGMHGKWKKWNSRNLGSGAQLKGAVSIQLSRWLSCPVLQVHPLFFSKYVGIMDFFTISNALIFKCWHYSHP